MTFFRYLLPVVAIGAMLSLQSPPLYTDVEAKGHVVLHILASNDDGEVVAEAVTQPLFAFRIEAGEIKGAQIMNCEQQNEEREKDGVRYPTVVLKCGEVKLVLSGVDLTVKK